MKPSMPAQPLPHPHNGRQIEREDQRASLRHAQAQILAQLNADVCPQSGQPLSRQQRLDLHTRWHHQADQLSALGDPPPYPAPILPPPGGFTLSPTGHNQ